jgi:F-type H+-transporting ATPase subunit h
MVQDMYLKELKAYKPPPEQPGEAEKHVQKFSVPKTPQSPEESDIQNDLKAYEEQVPEVEGQASGESAPVQDWFEEPEEDDDEHGHH